MNTYGIVGTTPRVVVYIVYICASASRGSIIIAGNNISRADVYKIHARTVVVLCYVSCDFLVCIFQAAAVSRDFSIHTLACRQQSPHMLGSNAVDSKSFHYFVDLRAEVPQKKNCFLVFSVPGVIWNLKPTHCLPMD